MSKNNNSEVLELLKKYTETYGTEYEKNIKYVT